MFPSYFCNEKSGLIEVDSLEGDNLVVFYYLGASEISSSVTGLHCNTK